MRRRVFLAVGVLGGTALAAAGAWAWLARPAARDAATHPDAAKILSALLPALLAGALPADDVPRASALRAGLARTQAAIAGMPPAVRREIGELLSLLASAPGRWLADIDTWEAATPTQVAAFLQAWRTHRVELLRASYQALHALTLGPWYADASTWERIGYGGPPTL